MTARKLFITTDGRLHRDNIYEDLKGLVYYAQVENKDIEEHNFNIILQNNIPCWPDINILKKHTNRQSLLLKIKEAGFIEHPVLLSNFTYQLLLPTPYVLKTGNNHSGEGKHLINSQADIPKWDGMASVEPFFEGRSIRVLIVGKSAFGIECENEQSWIKNSPGAEIKVIVLHDNIINHARSIAEMCELEIAGVDYIVDKSGQFHFLEINQFPGLDVDDSITPIVNDFFTSKMDWIEGQKQ